MSTSALYTDLSHYYDLMCQDIDYKTQTLGVSRLQQIFGNGGLRHLDLACGTGPHIAHFIAEGYHCQGLDLNQPMLDLAKLRCPAAEFSQQNICDFSITNSVDLITCFLYSLHYCGTVANLTACIAHVHQALAEGGVFCFNSVDKTYIDNSLQVRHQTTHEGSVFTFESGWFYQGAGEHQKLRLHIEKTDGTNTEAWHDEHPMVAISFAELLELLSPYFEVHLLEHDYEKIAPLSANSGNALVVCIKRDAAQS
jgi:ubiquinone/menaquinone biosynthesis C-methylase UbiE